MKKFDEEAPKELTKKEKAPSKDKQEQTIDFEQTAKKVVSEE